MAVHIYGITVDMDPLLEIAQKYNIKVIEDAAEELDKPTMVYHVEVLEISAP